MSWPTNDHLSLSNHQSVIPPVKWDQLGTYWASFWATFLLLSFLPLLQLHVLSFYQCDQGVTSPLELLHNTHHIRCFKLPCMKIYTHKNTNKAYTGWNLPWQSWIWGTSRSGTEASCEYTGATRRTRSPCRSPACEACRWGSGPPPLCSSCLCWCHRRSGADGREPCSDQSEQIVGRHIVRSIY